MSEGRFLVALTGRLAEGADPARVKANVAAMFKVPVEKVERLFTGKPVAIKKGLDEQTAKKYQLALQRAGAQARVVAEPVAAPAKAGAAAKPTAVQQAAHPTAAQRTEPATPESVIHRPAAAASKSKGETTPVATPGLQKSVVKQPPAGLGSLTNAQLDEPGVVLVEHQEVTPPRIDLTGLSVDEPGSTLVEPEPVPELKVDISGLSMDEPGAVLMPPEEVKPLQVDTSNLRMDEPGVVLVEQKETPEPKIDTSKLSLG